MCLRAIYTSERPRCLSRSRLSSLLYVSTTIEEQGLCTAAQNGTNIIIQSLINHGVNVNATYAVGAGALHICAAHGNVDSARLLLENKANINLIRRGGSPFHYATEDRLSGKRLAMMHLLLKYNADLSVRDRYTETILYRASSSGLTQEVELLLDNGAPLKDRQDNMTALMIASNNRRAETTRLLLQRGADVKSVLPAEGYDSLCLAVTGNRRWDSTRFQLESTINSLIYYGADVNGSDQKIPPLSVALREDSALRFAIIEVLLDAGADVEKADFMGRTPLETWISKTSWYDAGVLELLLNRGVDVNRLNGEHMSPLAQVCAAPDGYSMDLRTSVIQELIRYEADVNQVDESGNSPAMIISMNSGLSMWQKYRLLQVLLKSGASIWLENRDGETLLMKTMEHFVLGSEERLKVLNLVLGSYESS